MFETLTSGKMLFAQVVYKSDGVQFVNLLAFDGLMVNTFFFLVFCYFILIVIFFQTLSVNDELIKYGFAVYAPPSGIYRSETTEI
jgi:hypothetical protein